MKVTVFFVEKENKIYEIVNEYRNVNRLNEKYNSLLSYILNNCVLDQDKKEARIYRLEDNISKSIVIAYPEEIHVYSKVNTLIPMRSEPHWKKFEFGRTKSYICTYISCERLKEAFKNVKSYIDKISSYQLRNLKQIWTFFLIYKYLFPFSKLKGTVTTIYEEDIVTDFFDSFVDLGFQDISISQVDVDTIYRIVVSPIEIYNKIPLLKRDFEMFVLGYIHGIFSSREIIKKVIK